MSDLLNAASLIMIPSGYSEDKVYSAVPTDGSGDLSFTRSSNGTRINSAGLVEVTPWNFMNDSEDFASSFYTKEATTISSNSTTAPNGTTTADTSIPTTANTIHRIQAPFDRISGQEYTFSVYAKASGYNFLYMNAGTMFNARSAFNLSNGTIDTALGSATITNVGNGWYRCTVSGTASSSGATVAFLQTNSTTSSPSDETFVGNGTSGIFLWGAQLNIGSTAKPYFPTTDRLNVPRLTYQNGGGGCPSLLLEKQSTNSILYSEDITNVQWASAGGTATANTAISPDGTQNADTLTGARYQGGGASNTWTFSCYAKKVDGDNKFLLRLDVPSTNYAQFDLSTGLIDSISSGYSATITPVGNGWYRCTLTTPSSTSINNIVLVSASGGTYSTYVWGAQVEASSYPTSYISTTSASATRVADACSKTGISSLIGQTEGVIFIDFIPLSISDAQTHFSMYKTGVGAIGIWGISTFVFYTSGGCSITGGTITNNERMKIAFAYKQNDFVAYVNGVQVGTDSSGTVPACDTVNLGMWVDDSEKSLKKYNQFILFPTRLTNAELASLTTL